MIAKCGTRVAGSLVIGLCVASAVSGGGQLFVTYEVGLIQRFDSQTFELLGELPGTENFCCAVEIDPYRQYLWRQSSNIYDFDGNFVSTGGGGVTLLSIFEPISNNIPIIVVTAINILDTNIILLFSIPRNLEV